jgi:ATP-dependent protease ClpP protease subunit
MKRKIRNNNSPNKKVKNDDDSEYENHEGRVFNNHFYFYVDVNIKNILELNMTINEFNQSARKYDDIFLHIQSYGGNVHDALSTVDTILNSEIPVTTIVEGYAASAATLISISGDYRYIYKNAYMLVHQLSSEFFGKKCDIDDEHKNLNQLDKRLKSLYKQHTQMDKKEIEELIQKEIELDSETCINYGLADEIWTTKKRKFTE